MEQVTPENQEPQFDSQEQAEAFERIKSFEVGDEGVEHIPREQAAELADMDQKFKQALGKAFKGTGDVLAPNWQIQQNEADALADVWYPVLDRFLPDSAKTDLGAAAAVTLVIFSSRLGTPRHAPPPKKAQRNVNERDHVNDTQPEPEEQPQGEQPTAGGGMYDEFQE